MATEFLARFVIELQKNREEFLTLMQLNDVQGLENAAHKLHGACCFCGVPTLQVNVANMENLARTAGHIDELQSVFTKVIQSIDDVLIEYRHSYRTRLVIN